MYLYNRSDRSKGSVTPRAQSPYERPHRPTPTARRKTPIVRTASMTDAAEITRNGTTNNYLTKLCSIMYSVSLIIYNFVELLSSLSCSK